MSDCSHKLIFDPENEENLCQNCGIVVERHANSETAGLDLAIDDTLEACEILDRSKYLLETNGTLVDWSLNGLLASKISDRNVDFAGKPIKNPYDFHRLRLVNKFIVNSEANSDKSLRNAMWIIACLVNKLSLSYRIRERAAEIYKKAYKRNAVRGRSTKGFATASLFFACKEAGVHRNPTDFVTALSESPKWRNELFMNYKTLIQILGLESPPLLSPIQEIPRIAGRSGISERSSRKALYLYDVLRSNDPTLFYGKSPSAIAVCILYIATKYSNENIKQDVITKAGEISTVTLRKRCDEYISMLKSLNEPLPEFFLITQ